jgi:hypothetical protein
MNSPIPQGGASARRLVGAGLASAILLCTGAAAAKDFRPGDLRVCGRERCITIREPRVLRAFSSFLYGSSRPAVVRAPRAGTPAFELRFRNGFVAALVGSRSRDRIRVHGVNCGRFRRGTWYRLPPPAASAIKDPAARLKPFRVSSSPRSC